jgi:hypothetical protein
MTELIESALNREFARFASLVIFLPFLLNVLYSTTTRTLIGIASFLAVPALAVVLMAFILRLHRARLRNATYALLQGYEPDASPEGASFLVERSFHCLSRFPVMLSIDGRQAASVNAGGSLSLRLSPGRHRLAVVWASLSCEREIDTRTDDRMYIWFNRSPGDGENVRMDAVNGPIQELMEQEIRALNRFEFIVYGSAAATLLLLIVPMQLFFWFL